MMSLAANDVALTTSGARARKTRRMVVKAATPRMR
jgi:hypothetical protein